MASDRAKALAEKQRADAKAIREAKKHSDNPEDWGMWRQLSATVKMVRDVDQKGFWILIGVVAGIIVVAEVVGIIIGHWIQGLIWGVLLAASAFLLLLGRLGRNSAYKRSQGQPGYAQVALMMLNKKKWSYTPAIEVNRQQDSVHRVVGPGGLILVGDGDANRVKPLLVNARRRHEGISYDAEVIVVSAGDGAEQVPVEQLADYIKRLPKTLTETQIQELESRIKALDAMRGRLPLPKGPLPNMKANRRAIRGR
ncbi:MAG: DUF4191 domain-containing protein [Propionibacteriaceae bacterium]|jgi:hypothetical protein|nr:DUF4191 domain-containing protein [Propionibacteriaceae bacterium]